jgi:chloramphenicol O-acetyltransferase type A
VAREDKSFGFSFFEYDEDVNKFLSNAKADIERVKSSTGLALNPAGRRPDTIHYSPMPWVKFTSIEHPLMLGGSLGVPKINFGKAEARDSKLFMPFSIHLHHGFADGYHIGEFIEKFQNASNSL